METTLSTLKSKAYWGKWLGAALMTTAVTLHTLNIYPLNVYIQMTGAVVWITTAYMAKDLPLAMNFIPQLIIMTIGMTYISFG